MITQKYFVMKRVFFLGLAVVGLTMMSCKKDYMCTWQVGANEFTQEYKDYDKDDAEQAEKACDIVGGTFTEL